MRLSNLRTSNYRSIVDSGDIRIESFQGLVGENNSGKSNILNSINAFLTTGTGGINESDFFNIDHPIIITATFGDLTQTERKALRPYLLGEKLILEKHIALEEDAKSVKLKPKAQYHGYVAKPKDWWLSAEGVFDHEGTTRPKWQKIAEEKGILDYVRDKKTGGVNKNSYEAGLRRLLIDRDDIEFDEPKLGKTQALGLQPFLLSQLPIFRMLPAITDYSNEIDRRASQTSFRLLTGDLADRIPKYDPRYQQMEQSIKEMTYLLNPPDELEKRKEGEERLAMLEAVENKLRDIFCRLMPSVCAVRMRVEVDQIKDIFSRGVSILVDDGRLTEVVLKGHGLQRCVIFGLLQALILNQRGELIEIPKEHKQKIEDDQRRIVLAIEEPELFIHPQMQRVVYSVLNDFSQTDQVIYSTHSPAFIDCSTYERIGVVRKDTVEDGTKVKQCDSGVLDSETERKTFQFFSSFGLEQNNMFFAKKTILVEGEEDVIAIMAAGREMGLFREFPEKLGCTVVSTGSKQEMPKYMRLLNGFNIPYKVLHELDGKPGSEENETIQGLAGKNEIVPLPERLEDAVGHQGHFHKSYHAMKFFQDSKNITKELRDAVQALFA